MIDVSKVAGVARTVTVVLAVAWLAACAEVPKDPVARAEYDKRNDPLEPANRWVFRQNIAIDKAIARPLARGWKKYVPRLTRDNVKNFIDNFSSPVTFINDILQGESGRAAETFVRFWFNTVAGFGGLFDAAGELGLKRHEEDFGQTLAVWGLPDGPYLMILLLGPHSTRHLAGKVTDSQANPFSYLVADGGFVASAVLVGGNVLYFIDFRARALGTLEELEKSSLDFYASVRSLYRQNRKSEILNGKVTDLPVPGDDDEDEDE
ncbi:MAG: VacJ family lipoprotein [Pseudomonadota bacterium]